MKKVLFYFASAVIMCSVWSCEKTEVKAPDTSLCADGIKNGGETEVDCGGPCTACLPAGIVNCTLGGTDYKSQSTGGQILGPSIRIYSVRDSAQGRPLSFMFVPGPVNQPIRISDVSFSFSGEPYHLGEGDSGVVVLTTLDTVKQIASGTFSFIGKRITAAQRVTCTDGVFNNVRYKLP
jgi:hypothetical protein